MLKAALAQVVIFSLMTLTFSQPHVAQSKAPVQEAKTAVPLPANTAINIKKVVAENERRYKDRTASVDVKELEKIERKAPKGPGMSKKDKTFLAVFIVGLAVLVVLLVKYGKNCEVSDPPGCNPVTDENCTCTQYEQRN